MRPKPQTRQIKEWLSNHGIGRVFAGFARPEIILILRLQSRRSLVPNPPAFGHCATRSAGARIDELERTTAQAADSIP
jgi:hypothetical protein